MPASEQDILRLAPQVRSIALRVRAEFDLTIDLEELEAMGQAGLVEAASRFDASRGVPLMGFAYYRIRGAILDGVRKQGYLSPTMYRLRKAAEAADDLLEHAAESLPNATKNAADALVAADDILHKLTASFMLAAVGQSETTETTAFDSYVVGETTQRVRQALDTLPEREKAVVVGMYFEERGLDEIAKDLGVSKSWASRIHSKGIELLRSVLLDVEL